MNEKFELEWVDKTIMRNFKNMEIDEIKKLGEGWMSRAYLINNEFVFRFPKTKDAAADTEKEMKALPILKKYISLNIPQFIYVGRQENGYPFVGYKILPGEILDEQMFQSLSSKTKNEISIQIAEFMDQIHSFPVKQAINLHIPIIRFFQFYSKKYHEVKEKAFSKMDQAMQSYISRRFETYFENKENFNYSPTLLHADLSLDHMLFDQKGRKLTGIIDFGDLKIGDPDYEYLYLLEECGEGFTKSVMEIRKEENIQHKLEKLSFFVTADNILYLLEGLKRNHTEMVEEAIAMILCEMNG